MPGSLTFSTATLLGFLLTLVRIAGIFVFVPLPGTKGVADMARIMLSLGVTLAVFPQWPHLAGNYSVGLLAMWIFSDAALGIGIGLTVAFASEVFALGAQIMALQAGYAYAATIDPTTQADSSVLVVLAQLTTGLLFFALGLDREVVRIFAHSLDTWPAGSFVLARPAAEKIIAFGSTIFSTGLRLALPVLSVLMMVDISLALMGRVNAQLQLLTLAFPVKMMVALALLGAVTLLFPTMYRGVAGTAFSAARMLAAH